MTEPIRTTKVIEVVLVEFVKGAGTEQDPIRLVRQYWTKDGLLIAERDQHLEAKPTISMRGTWHRLRHEKEPSVVMGFVSDRNWEGVCDLDGKAMDAEFR
jgi:hypothetical protein